MITENYLTDDDLYMIKPIIEKSMDGQKFEIETVGSYEDPGINIKIMTDLEDINILCKIADNISPQLDEIRKNNGDFSAELWGICKTCQTASKFTGYMSCLYSVDNCHFNPEVEMLWCGPCHTKEFVETTKNICQFCNKQYNYSDLHFGVHLEFRVSKNLPTNTKQNNIVDLKGFDIHSTPLENWDFCSIQCAKIFAGQWIKKILKNKHVKQSIEAAEIFEKT